MAPPEDVLIAGRIAYVAEHYPRIPRVSVPETYVFPTISVIDKKLLVNGREESAASYIDHTCLSQTARSEQIERLCAEAREHRFAAVCVNGAYAAAALELLRGTDVKICCVVGFPLGASTARAKVGEAEELLSAGVGEIDSVINCGFLRDGKYEEIYAEIAAISEACHRAGAIHKVIIEAACLDSDELVVDACVLCVAGRADFVKTSTGMHSAGGATEHRVRLMRMTVGSRLGVKAAGGIKTTAQMLGMLRNGASRIGASCGVQLICLE